MGHRFRLVNMPGPARVWREQGLSLVFPGLVLPAAPAAPAAEPPLQASADAVALEGPAEAAPVDEVGPSEAVPDAPDAAQAAAPTPADQAPWPAPWDAYLQRVHPPHTIIWTYFELAQDFGDAPSVPRRKLWGRLLGNLPRGVVGFWPMSDLIGGVNTPRPELFWRGVSAFGAGHVLCFGRRAFAALFPDRHFAHEDFDHQGLRVHVLPDPALLLTNEDQALTMVEAVLAGLGR